MDWDKSRLETQIRELEGKLRRAESEKQQSDMEIGKLKRKIRDLEDVIARLKRG